VSPEETENQVSSPTPASRETQNDAPPKKKHGLAKNNPKTPADKPKKGSSQEVEASARDEEEAEAPSTKKKRGRPKGSKNTPKEPASMWL
jgi:hypothetical protein